MLRLMVLTASRAVPWRTSRVAPSLVLAVAFAVTAVACSSTTTSQPASGLQRVVVGDLAIRVPAEWRSYDYDFGEGWKGVSMADPRHEPSDAVIFGFYTTKEPGMTTAELGKTLADSMDGDGAAVRKQLAFLPSGIAAYEVRVDRTTVNGRTFVGLEYAFVRDSSSGPRGYALLYRAAESQAGHMAQFRTSARSIRRQPAAAPSTTTSGGMHATTLTRRERVWVRALFPLVAGIPDAGDEIAAALSDPAALVSGGSGHRRMDAALATFRKCTPTLQRLGPAPTPRLRALRGEMSGACANFGRAAVLLAHGIDKANVASLER